MKVKRLVYQARTKDGRVFGGSFLTLPSSCSDETVERIRERYRTSPIICITITAESEEEV